MRMVRIVSHLELCNKRIRDERKKDLRVAVELAVAQTSTAPFRPILRCSAREMGTPNQYRERGIFLLLMENTDISHFDAAAAQR